MVCSSALLGCSPPRQVPCVPHTPHTATRLPALPAKAASHTPDGKRLNMSRNTAGHQGDGTLCSGRRRQPHLPTLAPPGQCWSPGTGPPKTGEL